MWLFVHLAFDQIIQMPHMAGCVFMPGMTQTGFDFAQCLISRPQPPGLLSPTFSSALLKDKSQMKQILWVFFKCVFCIQSPKHNADASGNEVIIMHITDIEMNELKSLHV